MDWTAPVDGYCERLDPSFWAEPINALTNAGFVIVALVMASRLRGAGLPIANILVAILAIIGFGSFLFHTFAMPWAGVADVLPILLFVLVYTFAAARDYLGLRPLYALATVLGFFAFTAATMPLFSRVGLFGSSAGYMPVITWLAIFAGLTKGTASRGLWLATGTLAVSLTARTLDEPLCAALPMGTHWLWHMLNAALLGVLIETYRRVKTSG